MRNPRIAFLARALLLGTTVLAAAGVGAGDVLARVGVTSATTGDPLGKPPAENERVLRIGIDIQANELVTTAANDRAHLMFLDGTSLTVGPNAQLTIDKFVFDPNTKTGELAVTATKGVLRLVGGKISKKTPIVITTPSSTIGVRGGISILTVEPTKTTSTFVFGKDMTVNAGGQTQNVTRPGSQVTTVQGGKPSTPVIVPVGALNAPLNQLDGGAGGGAGGAGGGTTAGNTGAGNTGAGGTADQKSLSSGFSGGNSGNPASTSQVATTIVQPPVAQKINNSEAVANALTNQQTVILTEQAQSTAPTGQSASNATGPTVIVTHGRFLRDPSFTSFDSSTLAAPRNVTNNQALQGQGTVANGLAIIGTADGRSFVLPWLPGQRFAVDISSIFGRATGSGYVSTDGTFFGYVLTGSDNKTFGVFGGTPTTTAQFPTSGFAAHTLTNAVNPTALPFVPGPNATLEAAATISPLYSVYSQRLGVTTPPGVSPYQGAQSFQVTVAIDGQGINQRSYIGAFVGDYFTDFTTNTIFNSGVFTGSYRANATAKITRLSSYEATADTAQGNAIYGPNAENMVYLSDAVRSTVSGGVGTTTRTPSASFEQPYTNLDGSPYVAITTATRTATPEGVGQTRTEQTMTGYVGGIIESRDASGNFSTRLLNAGDSPPSDVSITTSPTTNRVQGTIVVRNFDGSGLPGAPIATFELGSTSGQRLADSAFIDDRIYGMRDREDTPRFSRVTVGAASLSIASRTVLTSYNAAPLANNTLPGGATACECAFLSWGWWNGDVRYDNSAFRPGERDRMNLSTYVVGTLTRLVDLPNTGTATYSGHAIGSVVNGSRSYVAGGTYTNSWNFASQTGAVSISNFDGATYSGMTALTAGTVRFTGGITGAGRAGAVNGAFFSSPSNPVAGQAGNFSVTGPGYKAGGTFAGQKQ